MSRRSGSQQQQHEEEVQQAEIEVADDASHLVRLQAVLVSDKAKFAEHAALYSVKPSVYVAEALMLLRSVDVPRNAKVYALLLGFQHRDHELVELLLSDTVNFGLPEVLAAARALDAPRAHRATEAKIASISNRPDVKAVLDRAAAKLRAANGEEDEEDNDNEKAGKKKEGDADNDNDGAEDKKAKHVDPNSTSAAVAAAASATRPKPPPPASLATPKSGEAWKRPPGKPKKPEGAEDLPRKLVRNLATITRLKSQAAIRANEKIEGLTATLSGHNQRFFCQWAEALDAEELGHFLLEFGLQSWAELADLVHIDPRKMKLPCFLPFAFATRSKYTAQSKLACPVDMPANLAFSRELEQGMRKLPNFKRAKLMRDSLDQVVEHRVPYGFLKRLVPLKFWDPAMKARVAGYLPLTTLLWWIEDLECPAVEALIAKRLAAGEAPSFGYGKLMERLMYCSGKRSQLLAPLIPLAQQTMAQYAMPLRTPMAVLGDCSASMQVAVRTASIIGSLLAALGSAELHFFNHRNIKPAFVPNTIKEVLVIADEIQANCATSPAASLEELYYRKARMETVVIVTDEEENTRGPRSNLMFADLADKYRKEISPECLFVFVSFLSASDEGRMVRDLKARGLPFVQCRLNGNRPDLTKLDMLLGKLSMDTPLREVATQALALVVSANSAARTTTSSAGAGKKDEEKEPASLGELSLNFRTESTRTVLQLLRRAAACVSEDRFADLKEVATSFFTCLGGSDFSKRCLTELEAVDSVAAFQRWVADAWTPGFERLAHAALTGKNIGEEPVRASYECGSLSRLPTEVMTHMLGFLPARQIDVVSTTYPKLLRPCKEASFDLQFQPKKKAVEAGRGVGGGRGRGGRGRGGRGGRF